MLSLIRFFIDRWVFSLSLFSALILFGIIAALGLGVDLLPEFNIPIVTVNTTYMGAGSEETARQVSEPIEDAIATLSGVSDITSFSGEGFSFVVAQFNFDVNVDQAAVEVKQRVDAIVRQLPDEINAPVIQKFDPTSQPIMNIALIAPGFDLREVQRFAEERLEPRLQQADGVADVRVLGPVEREVQVLLNPGRLQTFNLTPAQIAGAIGAASVTTPAGSMTLGDERILLAFRNNARSVRDIEEILVDSVRGLKVSDVAVVRDSASAPSSFVRLNGEPIVILQVRKVSGANSVATAANVRRMLEGLTLPDGYRAQIVGDTTVYVANSVNDTFAEMMIAIVVVAFIVLLFIGRLGSTFSVVLAIPITLIGAVLLFGLMGFTFNTVTLLAITVAVGLVVDDSIVIAENIERYRDMGYSPKDAVLKGAGEVSVAVLTATLSLLAVFLPIGFLPGIIGQFFAQFGLSLAATIAISYLEAMFFLTVRMAYLPNPSLPLWRDLFRSPRFMGSDFVWSLRLLKSPLFWLVMGAAAGGIWYRLEPRYLLLLPFVPFALFTLRYFGRILYSGIGAFLGTLHKLVDGGVNHLRDAYASSLRVALNYSNAVLIFAVLLVASLVPIFPRIPFNFVSAVDAGQLEVSLELPPGTTLNRTNEVASLLEAYLLTLPEARVVQTTVGSGGLLGTSSPEEADIAIELVPKGERLGAIELAAQLQTRLQAVIAAYPEAELQVIAGDGGAVPTDTGLSIRLAATDLETLQAREAQAKAVLATNPNLRNVSSSLEGSVSERVFIVDSARLTGTGLTPAEVAQTLRAYNVGIRATNLREGGLETPVQVKIDPVHVRDEQTLLSLPIYAPALQGFLPLYELGRFIVQESPVQISRTNQLYGLTLRADLAPGAPGLLAVRNEAEGALEAAGIIDDLVGYGSGGFNPLNDLVEFGPIAFAMALLLNYLVIASQFNSLKYPLYLLMTVPLALVGAFWIFYLTGSALDVISVLGVVTLIGLVTKNAILLLDVVVTQFEAGGDLKEALVEAGRLRLRPIIMTALTVLVITLPLLLGLGEGSEFRQPLGLIILGGVMSSTLLTLFVVPAAFYRFERGHYEKATLAPTPALADVMLPGVKAGD